MNSTLFSGEAKIHYGDSDFTILEPGGFVKCAVSGDPIPLEQLRYWSAERQEAYKDAAASLKRGKRFRVSDVNTPSRVPRAGGDLRTFIL